ncbi:MAG: 1-(5-phosphoribosyl)-5-[(5-phosphoribosylamino)methylideneamino]imidazole-4-carboxamide isomerase [Candidatus Hadarchaeales archaeon]
MLIIPAVDISQGRCVQLVEGKIETAKIYGDPVEWAKNWQREGAKCLHVVDLDAALGLGDNLGKILEILSEIKIPVQVGGGIRTLERAKSLIMAGAKRLAVGTIAIRNPELLDALISEFGGKKLVIAIDSRRGKIAVEGWQKTVDLSPQETVKNFEKKGVWGFLFTCVDVEGKMSGVDIEETRKLVSLTNLPVIASGGVGNLDDIRKLKSTGVYGVIIGKALYDGRFSLQEAMEVAST